MLFYLLYYQITNINTQLIRENIFPLDYACSIYILMIFIPRSEINIYSVRFIVKINNFLYIAGVNSSRLKTSIDVYKLYIISATFLSKVFPRTVQMQADRANHILAAAKVSEIVLYARECCVCEMSMCVGGIKEKSFRMFLTALSRPWTVGGVTCNGV